MGVLPSLAAGPSGQSALQFLCGATGGEAVEMGVVDLAITVRTLVQHPLLQVLAFVFRMLWCMQHIGVHICVDCPAPYGRKAASRPLPREEMSGAGAKVTDPFVPWRSSRKPSRKRLEPDLEC